ncbi:7759_t:CDS:10, partial [Gigaspora margarita]
HTILKCLNVKLLEEKCSMLIRALTLEQVLEYIITKGEEKKYTEWSDVETEVNEFKCKAFRHYQRLAKKDYICETDDPYDIVSETESEKFDQEKEEKMEDVYIEPREIIDSKALEREKEEEISNKENDYKELLQKVLNICNALSREIVQMKEETAGMNAEGLKKDKNPMFKFGEDLERSHSYEMDEIDNNLGWYYWNRTEVKKDRCIIEKDKLDGLENLTETDPANYEVLEEFNQKKEKKIETIPTDPRKIADKEEAAYFDLLVLDTYYDLNEIIEEPFDNAKFGFNEENVDGIYETEYAVKKNENKGLKVETEFLLTYQKLVEMDHADKVKDLKEYWTRIGIEKDVEKNEFDQKKKLKAGNVLAKPEELDNETIIKKKKVKTEDILVISEEFKAEILEGYKGDNKKKELELDNRMEFKAKTLIKYQELDNITRIPALNLCDQKGNVLKSMPWMD